MTHRRGSHRNTKVICLFLFLLQARVLFGKESWDGIETQQNRGEIICAFGITDCEQ